MPRRRTWARRHRHPPDPDRRWDLEGAEPRSRAILAAMPAAMAVLDAAGTVTDVNDPLCELFRCPREEILGARPPFAGWPLEQREAIAETFEQVLRERQGTYTLTLRRSDGARFPAEVQISPVELPSPALGRTEPGVVCVIRDLAEQDSHDERMAEVRELARLATWSWDPVSDVLTVSPELPKLAGVEIPSACSLDHIVPMIDPAYAQGYLEAMRAAAWGRHESFELIYPTRGLDEVKWVETIGRAVRDPSGRVIAVRGTTQDVTPEIESERSLKASLERLDFAQRLARTGSFEANLDTGEVSWSANLYRLVGKDPKGFSPRIGEGTGFIHEADYGIAMGLLEKARKDGSASGELRLLRDSEPFWVEARVERTSECDCDPGVECLRGTVQDISEQRRAHAEVELQASLLDAVDAAVIATDTDGKVTHWNAGAGRIYGWSREEALGADVVEVTVGPANRGLVGEILDSVAEHGRWEGEFEVKRKDGSTVHAAVRNAAVYDRHGALAGYVGVSVDIGEQVAYEQKLEANRDFLRAVTDSIGEGVYTLDEDGCLTYMNLAAENLIGWTAQELMGRRLHEAIHYRHADGTPHSYEECPITRARHDRLTVRIDDDIFIRRDGSELPVEYTVAPFRTEQGVVGSVVVFSDISERKAADAQLRRELESLSWVARIRNALDGDRFVVFAQPIIDLSDETVTQFELLIRMRDEDGTLIQPGRFLPVAEEHGLVEEIDRWMLARAGEIASLGVTVNVNVSAYSVSDPRMIETVSHVLERTGADPGRIVIELTETALLTDEPAAIGFAHRIEELGCQLALDDFGTGYGGFTYLKRLPVSLLKIDREFVRDLAESEASRQVVRAVVSLAAGFGQKTVAEGVEDERVKNLLVELGVDRAQGYAIRHPGPIDEVIAEVAVADPEQ